MGLLSKRKRSGGKGQTADNLYDRPHRELPPTIYLLRTTEKRLLSGHKDGSDSFQTTLQLERAPDCRKSTKEARRERTAQSTRQI
jgi:hypothetical protein